MRRLCTGWVDLAGVKHACPDPVMDPGDGPDDQDVTHGFCPGCHGEMVAMIDELGKCDAGHLREAAR